MNDNGGTKEPDPVSSAVLTGSRVLVGIAVRSLSAVGHRVTLPQLRMLVVLSARGETKLVAMAEQLAVNSSTAMRMADRLAGAGLIVRTVNPGNRRESLMRLTPEGQDVVDRVNAHRREEIRLIVSRMAPEHRQALIDAMAAFNEAAGEPPADGWGPASWP